MRTSSTYYPALDGLRLLAIVAVILHHCVGEHHRSLLLRALAFQTGNGIGVPLFLLLSGLLLTSILLNTTHLEHRYRNFLFRRAVRVFPLYYMYLGLAAAVTWMFTSTSMHNVWIYGFFLQGTLPGAAGQTGSVMPMYHFWTLGIQEQFYVLWPLLVWSCKSLRQVRRLCWGGVAVSIAARALVAWHFGPGDHLGMLLPCRAGELCFGGLLAVEIAEPTWLSRVLPKLLLPLAATYFVWTFYGLDFSRPMGLVFGLELVTAACGALVLASVNPTSIPFRIFGSKVMGSLGKKYSYALFVFHPLILKVFSLPKLHLGIVRYPMEAAAAAMVAWASYNLYERRFLRIRVVSDALAAAQVSCPRCHSTHVCRMSSYGRLSLRLLLYFGRARWECFHCSGTFLAPIARNAGLSARRAQQVLAPQNS